MANEKSCGAIVFTYEEGVSRKNQRENLWQLKSILMTF